MMKRCAFNLTLSLAALFLAFAAFGQEAEKKLPRRTACEPDTCISKVMHLPNLSTPNEMQDVVNAFRLILEITHITQDPSEHTISLQGTPEQLAIAERLVSVVESFKSSGGSSRSSVLVYEPQGSIAESNVSGKLPEQAAVAPRTTHCKLNTCFIKAMYLPDLSVRQLQEALTRLHSNVQIARITMFPSSHAIILQGTSEQFALVERAIDE